MKKLAFKKSVLLASVLFCCLATSQIASASDKIATCKIVEQGKTAFKGKCKFYSDKGGSFSVSNVNPDKPIVNDTMMINVYVVKPNVAEVSGLVYGHGSNWGQAIRSNKERACWVGSDFKICVW